VALKTFNFVRYATDRFALCSLPVIDFSNSGTVNGSYVHPRAHE